MKRIEHLIKKARRNTENEQVGITDGIDQQDFVRFANEANRLVRSKMVQSHSHKFIEVEERNTVANQEFYTLTNETFMNYNIVSMYFSENGQKDNMYLLNKRSSSERVPITGYPTLWWPSANGFYANPITSSASGIFYVNKVARTRQLGLRSATVASNTYDTSTGVLSALTITATTENGALANQKLDEDDYLTLVDASGVVKMKGIQYSSIDTGTGVVTLEGGSFTASEGSTIANGDYVIKGPFASSHSQMGYEEEDAVLAFMEYLVLKRDSSTDSQEQLGAFSVYMEDLIDSLEKDNQETYDIPIISSEYL